MTRLLNGRPYTSKVAIALHDRADKALASGNRSLARRLRKQARDRETGKRADENGTFERGPAELGRLR